MQSDHKRKKVSGPKSHCVIRNINVIRLFILSRQGKARQGKARQGKARQGKARQGKARQGKARQGKARQNVFSHNKEIQSTYI